MKLSHESFRNKTTKDIYDVIQEAGAYAQEHQDPGRSDISKSTMVLYLARTVFELRERYAHIEGRMQAYREEGLRLTHEVWNAKEALAALENRDAE